MAALLPCAGAAAFLDHAHLQFAGEVGFLSVGTGKAFSRYTVGGMYGLVPKELAGGETIETVVLRQTYRFWDWRRFVSYVGLNAYHVLGLRYESSRYGRAPRSYYPVSSVRGLLSLGGEVATNGERDISFYAEAGLNDIWLTNWAVNGETVNPLDHVSLAMGWKKLF